jgi:signal peptidase I
MEDKNKKRSIAGEIWEYIKAFAVAIVLALIIRTFVVQAFKIPSGSMIPSLQIGDHILVNKFIYWFTEPQRGDIIVFKYPRDKRRDFIKRVVGLPGETIRITERQVYINDKPLTETYAYHQQQVPPGEYISPRDNFGPLKIPLDSVFVMGDNRDSSMDSRYWGPLKKNLIRGEAFLIYWSIKPYPNPWSFIFSHPLNYLTSFRNRIRWQRLVMVIR